MFAMFTKPTVPPFEKGLRLVEGMFVRTGVYT